MNGNPRELPDGRCWNGLAYVHNEPVAGCSCGSCADYFEKIVRGGDLIEYCRLKREGYVTAWSGEGKICMVKRVRPADNKEESDGK